VFVCVCVCVCMNILVVVYIITFSLPPTYIQLFVEFQISSDLLSFDGQRDEKVATKIGRVRFLVERVLGEIEEETNKQLEEKKKQMQMQAPPPMPMQMQAHPPMPMQMQAHPPMQMQMQQMQMQQQVGKLTFDVCIYI
jgi:hypothetical protein